MPATEPPKVAVEPRKGERFPDPNATKAKGSWRTLIQEFDGEQWITRHEYPGDWALQWEAVATSERHAVSRMRAAMDACADKLRSTF